MTAVTAAPRSMFRTAAASLVLAASVAGCTVGPDYVAPTTDLDAFHNLDAVSARKTVTPAAQLDRWWTGFNDPMLVTVV
jgi:outer membrane protein TolC